MSSILRQRPPLKRPRRPSEPPARQPPAPEPDPPPELPAVALDPWAQALASVEWLLDDQLDRPEPHVRAVLDHLAAGGDVETCPCLTDSDRPAIADLLALRMGRAPVSPMLG